jgi:hypothetical protein
MVVDYSMEERMRFYNQMSAARITVRRTEFQKGIKDRMDFSIDMNLKLYEVVRLDYIQHQIQAKMKRPSMESLLEQL